MDNVRDFDEEKARRNAQAAAEREQDKRDPFRWMTWDKLSTTPLGDPPWVIPGLEIGPGRPCGLWGYGGTGKSWIAQAMVLCVAAGRKLFGAYDVRQGRVAHVSHELGTRALMERYRRLANGMVLHPDEIGERLVVSAYPKVYLNSRSAEEWYLREFDGCSLGVIDSLRRALPGEDENSSEMSNHLDMLSRVSDRTGCSFLTLHHVGKAGIAKDRKAEDDKRGVGRGSSAIFDGSGCIWLVEGKGRGPRTLHQVRAHDDGDGDLEPVSIDLEVMGISAPLYEASREPVRVRALEAQEVARRDRLARRKANTEAYEQVCADIVSTVEEWDGATPPNGRDIRRSCGDTKKVKDALADLVLADVLATKKGARDSDLHSLGPVTLQDYLHPPKVDPDLYEGFDDGV